MCECYDDFKTIDVNNPCSYRKRSKTIAFLLSFFLGPLGADRFYLAVGNGTYIFAGAAKLTMSLVFYALPLLLIPSLLSKFDASQKAIFLIYISKVGLFIFCGIWWLSDWISIILDNFPDGNGHELTGFPRI